MNKMLTAGTTLSILEQLRHTVGELGLQEKALIEARDSDLAAIRRKFESQKATVLKEADAQAALAQDALNAERERIEARFESRRLRIKQAIENASKALHDAAEHARSQQQYENQKDLLQAQRVYDADTLAMDQTWKSYVADLSVEIQRLEGTQPLAWKVFRGYRSFRSWLQRELEPAAQDSSTVDEYALLQTLRSQLTELEAQLRFSMPTSLAQCFSIVPVWVLLAFIGVMGAVGFFVPQVSETLGIAKEQLLLYTGVVACLVVAFYTFGYILARG